MKNEEEVKDDERSESMLKEFRVLLRNEGWPQHEAALYCLLMYCKEKDCLPMLNDRFHKNFRQIDVTESGHIDSAIWQLLDNAPIFWRLFEKYMTEEE